MPRTINDNTARAYDAQVEALPGRGQGGTGAPSRKLTAVQDAAGPVSSVTHKLPEQSNRAYYWAVGAGLAILIALLVAVMLNAGINVQVLP